MIAFSNDTPRKEALRHFDRLDMSALEWTPKRTLKILVSEPADGLSYFQDDIDLTVTLAPALADGKPMESRVETDRQKDAAYMVFSGEDTASLALAIRDELKKKLCRQRQHT